MNTQQGVDAGQPAKRDIRCGKVFLAQYHVQEPTDRLFRLVGNRPALVKVHVSSEEPQEAPAVVVMLELGNEKDEFTLRGPRQLPKPHTGDPKLMPHSYDDSFTGIVPREWIQPGLKVTVELRSYCYPLRHNEPGVTGTTVHDRRVFDRLDIGAPSKLLLTMFDIHFFQEEKGMDFAQGWEEAIFDKFPLAGLKVQRVRPIVFEELVMVPRAGKPALRVRGEKEYEERTGVPFDGESATARHWMRALKRAGGRKYGHGVVFINVAYVEANGWGEKDTLSGTTDLGRIGNFHHELGHVFSLPHWDDDPKYPYKGDMLGIKAFGPNFPHVGPTWAYSLHRRAFIPPTVQSDVRPGMKTGTWKKDPMEGGGHGDQEEDFMVRHFSDYSVNQMQRHMEKKMLLWDDKRKGYYRWNDETRSFSIREESDGWNLAEEPFAEVVSVILSFSGESPEANFVYPPIGPYRAGLLTRFDADSPESREQAGTFGFTDETCNLCARVTQGGNTNTYLLEAMLEDATALACTAINLPAADGPITEVELLFTPGVVSRGASPDAKVLYRWSAT